MELCNYYNNKACVLYMCEKDWELVKARVDTVEMHAFMKFGSVKSVKSHDWLCSDCNTCTSIKSNNILRSRTCPLEGAVYSEFVKTRLAARFLLLVFSYFEKH